MYLSLFLPPSIPPSPPFIPLSLCLPFSLSHSHLASIGAPSLSPAHAPGAVIFATCFGARCLRVSEQGPKRERPTVKPLCLAMPAPAGPVDPPGQETAELADARPSRSVGATVTVTGQPLRRRCRLADPLATGSCAALCKTHCPGGETGVRISYREPLRNSVRFWQNCTRRRNCLRFHHITIGGSGHRTSRTFEISYSGLWDSDSRE